MPSPVRDEVTDELFSISAGATLDANEVAQLKPVDGMMNDERVAFACGLAAFRAVKFFKRAFL